MIAQSFQQFQRVTADKSTKSDQNMATYGNRQRPHGQLHLLCRQNVISEDYLQSLIRYIP